MGWRDYQKAAVEHDSTVTPDAFANLEKEYHDLLTRYWSPEADDLPGEELQRMIARLDVLFQELTRQGRRLPILTEEGRAYLREDTAEVQAA